MIIMKNTIAALIAVNFALAAAGCGQRTLYITDPVLDEYPEFAEAIAEAAEIYCEKGYECVHVVAGRGDEEVRVADESVHGNLARVVVDSWGDKSIYVYRLVRGKPLAFRSNADTCKVRQEADALEVALHEMGHFLGFDHVDDKQNIMYPDHRCTLKGRFLP